MWFTKCVKYIRFKLHNEFLFSYNCRCICHQKHFCKKKKTIVGHHFGPQSSPTLSPSCPVYSLLCYLIKATKKKKVQKSFCMMYKWKCLFTAVYLDTVKFILHIDHDLCFKYHWTFNHFFYWLASEYLNIHFSSRVAVWVLSECSVNSDRFVFLPQLG